MSLEDFTESSKSIVEVRGTIKDIEPRKNFKDNTNNFNIITDNNKDFYKIRCPFFCPISEGDRIAAIGNFESHFINLIIPPLVLIGYDTYTLEGCFTRALFRAIKDPKQRSKISIKVRDLYSFIKKIVTSQELTKTSGELISDCITEKSENFVHERSRKCLEFFEEYLNAKEAEIFLKWWYKHRCLRRLYLLGLTLTEIRESDLFPTELFNQAFRNPFTIPSLSIQKAEHILKIQGKTSTEEQRNSGLIIRHIYNKCFKFHHEFIYLSDLEKNFSFVKFDATFIITLMDEYGVVFEDDRVYFRSVYETEKLIIERYSRTQIIPKVEDLDLPKHLTEDQVSAINLVLNSKWSILTGPGGSGKTTIIQFIIDYLISKNKFCLITAFTGKAVSRILEVIDEHDYIYISTIHRALKLASEDIIKYEYIFIDETSMVNIVLFGRFLRKLSPSCKFVFVGDPLQLPPINWSSVFDALIESNNIPIAHLEKIHRTSNESNNGVYINSRNMRKWQSGDPFKLEVTPNFQLIPGTIDTFNKIATTLVSSGIPLSSIMVICPYNKYLDQLNETMRNFIPSTNEVTDGINKKKWRVGDRVMMIKNNYDIGVMNGEEGTVISVNSENIKVVFQKFSRGKKVLDGFPFSFSLKESTDDLQDFEDGDAFYGELTTKYISHSFAITFHKSQGSGYPVVLIFIPPEATSGDFLDRRFNYVGMTRPSKSCLVIGNITTFTESCVYERNPVNTYLHERIKSV